MASPRRRQRGVFANANINRQDLIAWLDAQEQKPFLRVASLDETVEGFDALYNEPEVGPLPQRIVDLYEVAELGEEGRGARIRRTKKWRFDKILSHSLVSRIRPKIRTNVRNRHKLNYRFGYELVNTETGKYTVWYKNINSPWFPRLSETQAWLQEQENIRLQGENIDRPSTKWGFQRHVFVDLKAILDRRLNTRKTKELEQSFSAAYPKLPFITLRHLPFLEKHFKQAIAACSVTKERDFILIHQPSYNGKVSHPTMNIGIYENHAFLILDINKASNNYTCGECMARFTKSCNLIRHASRCTSGRTEINCPGNQILAPESTFEKAFYFEGTFGKKGIRWLGHLSRESGKHIHHHKCGQKSHKYCQFPPYIEMTDC